MATCLICNDINLKFLFEKNAHEIYKCNNCQTELVYPLPDDETIAKVYANHQYHTGDRYNVNNEHQKINLDWKKRLRLISILSYQKGKMLDIGCATGIFLQKAKQLGWAVQGLETSENAAAIANELLGKDKIKVIDVISYNTNNKFDVITMWALIEHVKDPRKYFSKVYELLKPGGLIALSTPNTLSFTCKLLKKEWRYYIPPEHLFYFNQNSLRRVLSRAGFRIVKIRTHFNHIALFKRNSRLLKTYNTNFIFRTLTKLFLIPTMIVSKIFHFGETMEIYAVKK